MINLLTSEVFVAEQWLHQLIWSLSNSLIHVSGLLINYTLLPTATHLPCHQFTNPITTISIHYQTHLIIIHVHQQSCITVPWVNERIKASCFPLKICPNWTVLKTPFFIFAKFGRLRKNVADWTSTLQPMTQGNCFHERKHEFKLYSQLWFTFIAIPCKCYAVRH